MEFDLSPQFNFALGMNTNPSLEFLEDDDDEFYTEMRRQIMILTGDQNDDFPETKVVKPSYCSVTKVVKPSYSGASKPRSLSITSSHGCMSLWQYEYNSTNSEAVPVQHAESWGISTGTGVFIPLSTVKPIRNNKPKSRGRVNGRRIYKRADNKH